MVLLDELGWNEKSGSNPLKVFSQLDYEAKEDGISFVRISNYALEPVKINRVLVLSLQDLDKISDK